MAVHFKICGVTNLEDADAALEVGASSVGVNLVPGSPRVVDLDMARRIAAILLLTRVLDANYEAAKRDCLKWPSAPATPK